MVKFYNPFKWHLIQYNNRYYVRRLSYTLMRWNYADNTFPNSFTWSSMQSHAQVVSLDTAIENLKTKRNPPKVEVIHGIPD